MKKLIIIGICIWCPIYIFSYTNLAETILNNPKNGVIAIITVFVMLVGIILMFFGLLMCIKDKKK
jgi:hypothetical protein